MAKAWKKFKLRCRYIDTAGMAHEKNVVITARSVKEAINRWLYKKCANDVAKRARYHLWMPDTQLPLEGLKYTQHDAAWDVHGTPEKDFKHTN